MVVSYQQSSDYNAKQVDELIISNILNALNNPRVVTMLDESEQNVLLQVVTNHVVLQSKKILDIQNEYYLNNGNRRTR